MCHLIDLLLELLWVSEASAHTRWKQCCEEAVRIGNCALKVTINLSGGSEPHKVEMQLGVNESGAREFGINLFDEIHHLELIPVLGLFNAKNKSVGMLD